MVISSAILRVTLADDLTLAWELIADAMVHVQAVDNLL
jgi:hypothetical protein